MYEVKVNMDGKKIINTLKDFKENNAEKYGILTLGIFGSVARNYSLPDSDIDIVITTVKADLFLLVHLKDELEKILNAKIDIVRYRKRMNKYLKKHIDEEAIYV